MRVTLEVTNVGYAEQGVNLIDRDKNFYYWITKTKKSPIVYSDRTGEWFKVRADVYFIDHRTKGLKNVRVIK